MISLPELRRLHARLADERVSAIDPTNHGGSWSLYFSDLDGNPWEITCYQHAVVTTLLKPVGT